MRRKLFILLAIILFSALVLAAIFNLRQAQELNAQRIRDQLISSTELLARLPESELEPETLAAIIEHLNQKTDLSLRVTLIAASGEVLYDNVKNKDNLDNHLTRAEIQAALHGQGQMLTRHSASLGQEQIYYAVADKNGDKIVRLSLPLQIERDEILAFRQRVLLVTVLTGLALALSLHLISRRIMAPIDHLTEKTRSFAAGDLSQRIEMPEAPSEIQELLESFNKMAAQIEFAHSELQSQREWLASILNTLSEPLIVVNQELEVIFANHYAQELFARPIDASMHPYPQVLLTHAPELDDFLAETIQTGEIQRREISLKTMEGEKYFGLIASPQREDTAVVVFNDLSAAYENQKMRADFVANVSHELKTPLTSIRGFVETLQTRPELSPEERSSCLHFIEIESARLERLIQELLILGKIEAEEEREEASAFDFTALCDEVLVQLEELASERAVRLIPAYKDESCMIRAHRDRLKQLLLNLLDNGIKYNRRGGYVELSFEVKPEEARGEKRQRDLIITVRDNGRGISKEAQKRVFERFYRAENSEQSPAGSGLGLAIVKHIALLYNGTCQLESQPGEGTTFTIILRGIA